MSRRWVAHAAVRNGYASMHEGPGFVARTPTARKGSFTLPGSPMTIIDPIAGPILRRRTVVKMAFAFAKLLKRKPRRKDDGSTDPVREAGLNVYNGRGLRLGNQGAVQEARLAEGLAAPPACDICTATASRQYRLEEDASAASCGSTRISCRRSPKALPIQHVSDRMRNRRCRGTARPAQAWWFSAGDRTSQPTPSRPRKTSGEVLDRRSRRQIRPKEQNRRVTPRPAWAPDAPAIARDIAKPNDGDRARAAKLAGRGWD